MPLPTNLALVTVKGRFVRFDGSPMSGQVTFTPSGSVWLDTGAATIIGSRQIAAPLNAYGAFSIKLPATDDTDLNPTGFTYSVLEPTGRSYNITLPATGSPVDLSDIVPTSAASPGVVQVIGGTGSTAPVTLSASSGVATPDATAGTLFVHVASADVQLGPPSGGTNGRTITILVKASGAARTVSFPSGGPDPVTIAAGEWATFRFVYYQPDDVWIPA